MSAKTLLKGGCVLTLGNRTPNFAEADVLIEDGRIVEVGPNLRSRGAEIIDATGTIVMPGFVDSHRHAWRSLFRNFGAGIDGSGSPLPPSEYGPHYSPDDVYAATLIGLLGAAESGTTTVADFTDVAVGGEFDDAILQAHADSGIRTVLAAAVPVWAEDRTPWQGRLASITAGAAGMERTRVAAGPADPALSGAESVDSDWAFARQSGARIHAHVGRATTEDGIVAAMGSRNLLGEDVTLIHCSLLGEADLDAVASSGAWVAITPSSEMAGGLGTPPIQMLIDRDIRPGLGVDDEGVAPGDMFAQMRATNSIQHGTMFDLKLAGKAGLPNLLTTREVIRYATIDGANAIGLGSLTGSLEPGKQADVIVLRADRPNISPINDPIGAIVWGMDTSNLDWVFVGGEPLMRQGELTGDVARARGLAVAARERVAKAAGLMTSIGEPA